MNVPGLKLAVPASPADAKGLLKSALRGEDPVLYFEHKMLYAERGPVLEDSDFLASDEARYINDQAIELDGSP